MDKPTIPQPNLETWNNLPCENIERKPKVIFDINIPVKVKFISNEPRSFLGENGAYFIFDVLENGEQKVIMTSAWTLLRSLKIHTPLNDKELKITKKLIKGKQNFEVE